ncbi:MAG: DUF4126 domain-containing protein [Thermomicrobiales bacterium]|nr:DUF4126 domain-containing protein [Thermomicrobiales bacterium]
MFTLFLTGIGLSASAGLNAYFPLLILALADRATNVVNLPTPYNWLSSNTGLLVILILLSLELVPDKIAKIDHLSDLVHTAIRPGAAALAFMAVAHQNEHIHLVTAMLFGLVIGGAVHWLKASSRPQITESTRGLGNPIISLLEDMLSGTLALIAIFLPYGVIVILPLGFWYLHRTYQRMQRGETRILQPFKTVMEAAPAGDVDQS